MLEPNMVANPEELQSIQFVINFLKFFLRSGGIFRLKSAEIWYTSSIIIVTFLLQLGEIIGLVNRTIIQEQVEMLLNLGINFFYLVLYFVIRFNRTTLQDFVSMITSRSPDYVGGDAMAITAKRFKKLVPTTLFVFFLFLSMCICAWMVVPLFITFDYENKNFFLGPFLFECPDSGRNRFPVKPLCWHTDNFWEYLSVNMLHTIFAFWGSISYATTFTFYVLVTMLVDMNTRVMCARILNIQSRVKKLVDQQQKANGCTRLRRQPRRKDVYDQILQNEFLKIIKYYQYLYRILDHIIPFLNIIAGCTVIAYCSLISLASFLVVNESESTGYFMFRVKIGGIITNGTMLFSIYCYGAEVVLNTNRRIAKSIYNMPWYAETPQFRKLCIRFLVQLQTCFHVRALGMYPLSLNLFTRVLRTTYSSLNLMLAQFGRK